MNNFKVILEKFLEESLVVTRKKHKGVKKKMTATAKREKNLRDKKKSQLGIESGGKYKLKDGKKVKKTPEEIRRKIKTIN